LPRPLKCRVVGAAPATTYFKPRGVPMHELTEMYLGMDGFQRKDHPDREELMVSTATCAFETLTPGAEQHQKELDMDKMDKIAVTCDEPDLDGPLDSRFGRAAGFMIIDPRTLEFTYLDNGGSQAMAQGAGIQAAENVARSGAKAVLTGYVGPKAFQALTAAKITIIQNLENLTVRQAVERFNEGNVAPASQPNKRGHWK
jgi:predicted Fe-Mo cluster-binding NifX family protein